MGGSSVRTHMVEESIQYIRNFIKDPLVASVSPTSGHATRELMKGMDLSTSSLVVEYGPGNGVITKELLRKMPEHARLLAVEINEDFYRELKRLEDPRLILVKGSAEDIVGIMRKLDLPKADVVVSGIPFSMLKPPIRRSIVEGTQEVLQHGGSFHVYQASKQMRRLLREYFQEVEITFVWKNLPPLFILRANLPRPAQARPVVNLHSPLVNGRAG